MNEIALYFENHTTHIRSAEKNTRFMEVEEVDMYSDHCDLQD
jgi:hypothetical protein